MISLLILIQRDVCTKVLCTKLACDGMMDVTSHVCALMAKQDNTDARLSKNFNFYDWLCINIKVQLTKLQIFCC